MSIANLSAIQFEEIFTEIISGKINEESIKEFLINLNQENLPQNAFLGAISSLKKQMKTINAPKNSIDLCGTGGDKLGTLNISTATCFVVAGLGISVAKHGNKAVSSLSGSADIFSELGIKISLEKSEIENNLKEKKLAFLFAPLFHEALKNVAKVRKEMAIPTIFNFLGPLLNPANTNLQLIGTSRRDSMIKMAKVIAQNKENKAFIVHGFDGMDEITLSDNSYLIKVENGEISNEEIINPENFGLKKVALEELKGGDVKYNAQKLIALLNGEKSAYREIVALNAAFALKLAGRINDITAGIITAKEAIDSGKAMQVLKNLQKN
jgi:anthranilate phosphoribosyltransferase